MARWNGCWHWRVLTAGSTNMRRRQHMSLCVRAPGTPHLPRVARTHAHAHAHTPVQFVLLASRLLPVQRTLLTLAATDRCPMPRRALRDCGGGLAAHVTNTAVLLPTSWRCARCHARQTCNVNLAFAHLWACCFMQHLRLCCKRAPANTHFCP
jgi:hypothetical protein